MYEFAALAGSTLVSEDLACIAAGALVASGRIGYLEATAACFTGILAGDLLLYAAGRFGGRPVLALKPVRRWLKPELLERASEWLARRGAVVVLGSRFTPGMRLPVYVAAGLLRTDALKFAGYFAAACAVWTPMLVGLSAWLGAGVVQARLGTAGDGLAAFAVLAPALCGARWAAIRIARRHRRDLTARLRRLRWEFWPAWAAYLPLIPYLGYLAIRHRSATLFTAANPGIPSGGFVGESKSQILAGLAPSGAIARYASIPSSSSADMRVELAARFLQDNGLDFPVVVKPDVGERGSGVAIVRSRDELTARLRSALTDIVVQEYIEGPEFGIFYVRRPGGSRGWIFSVTEKRFPCVAGDGHSTLAELIRGDERASAIAPVYLSSFPGAEQQIPAAGALVQLVDIGSHCRGAVFLNGGHHITPELEARVDAVARKFEGFYFGRFDVRADSAESLARGQFRILELNGVTSEATHIYDPCVTVWQAYKTLFAQWRLAFEIGAANRLRGQRPTGVCSLIQLIGKRFAR